jgi:hypothetical protein
MQIACRLLVPQPLRPATKEKISMFCHVASEQVFGVHDVTSVYHVPLLLQSQGIVEYLRKRLSLDKLDISKEMIEKGVSLGKKWKAITTGYVDTFTGFLHFILLIIVRNDYSTPSASRLSENTPILKTHTCRLPKPLSILLSECIENSLSMFVALPKALCFPRSC